MRAGKTLAEIKAQQVRTRTFFALPFDTKNDIILPRQARDKHSESTQKEMFHACSYLLQCKDHVDALFAMLASGCVSETSFWFAPNRNTTNR